MKKLYILLASLCLFIKNTNAQIPNSGFENYTFTTSDTLPVDWSADSYWSTQLGRSTSAHGGNYSFAINTWYHYSPGMLVNGIAPAFSMFYNWPQAGTPVSSKPARLKGFYMYTDTVNGDSAIAQVLLKKYNTTLHKIDTVAIGKTMLPYSASFTQFQVDLSDMQPGVQPDSIVVFFMTYDYLAGTQPICVNPICRYLWIDDLSLEGALNVGEIKKEEPELIFSAEQNILHVISKKSKQETIDIFAADGKKVFNATVSPGQNTIDISALAKGVYFARLATGGKAIKWVKS